MSDKSSILTALVEASRPYRPFTAKINGDEFTLLARRLSAAESATVAVAQTEEFGKVMTDLEKEGSTDLAQFRRVFDKLEPEKLVDYLIMSEKADILGEASSLLDDLPPTDERVKARAEILEKERRGLYLGAPVNELIDKAIDQRIYVYASFKSSYKRNVMIVLYSVYTEDKEHLFQSTSEVEELDSATIDQMLLSMAGVLGEQKTDPLKPAEQKSSRKRSASVKPSVED